MIQYYKKEGKTLKQLEVIETNCWINIAAPFSKEELEELSGKLDIPLDFLIDSLDIDERSRYETEDGVRLIVLNTPILNPLGEENVSVYITIPIGIILTLDHIITITSFENHVLQKFLDNKIKHFDPSNKEQFALQIFEQNVYHFLSCLKEVNSKRNLIEKELYDSSKNKELRQLLNLEKSLVYFVTSLSSNELLMMKMKRTDYLKIRDNEELLDLLDDVIIDNSQAQEMANIYSSILGGTMNAFASIISNNLSMVIQRLTLITIILMVPTLVASFFGMNVKHHMEESNSAFYYIVITSIILSLVVAWVFRRQKLL